ncbi:hypothetical protein NDU88_006414 [Pleurodeles waltl]|uniref:Uncharacterized protein n=1 Tax=Pleurodeles waltl TaxID=8319 RepID=A0AAV7VPJ1_PLEWA|nr:hypothetical protein NDU88_006414 [Pleurodeles waltl]
MDGVSGGATGWACATLELQKSCWAVSRFLLWGSTSTSRIAERALAWGTIQEPGELVKNSGGGGRRFSPTKVGDRMVRGSILEKNRRGGHKKEDNTNKIIKLSLPLGWEGGEEKGKLQGRSLLSEEVGSN